MAQFSVNAQRFDPYKNFKFRVKWDGQYVAGVSKVTALKRTTESRRTSRRRRPQHQPKVPGPDQITSHYPGAGCHPRQRFEELGQQGLELRRRSGGGVVFEGFP